MMLKNILANSLVVAALVVSASVAQAADSCTKNFTQAAAAGSDLKQASLLLEKAGNCCSTDLSAAAVQGLINDIKSIVNNTNAAMTKGGDKNEAGKILSTALDCAGQPSLVAADPSLYSQVLADSAQVVELARDEAGEGKDGLGRKYNFALNPPGSRPSNNQQPTVSVEQK